MPAIKQVDSIIGSDLGTGNPGDPWQTIAPVRTYTTTPGDIIELTRGSTFGISGTTLALTLNGIPGMPVRVRASGSGAAPIINGAGVTPISAQGAYYLIEGLDLRVGGGVQTKGLIVQGDHLTVRKMDISGYGASGSGNHGAAITLGSALNTKFADVALCRLHDGIGDGVSTAGAHVDVHDCRIEDLSPGTQQADGIAMHGDVGSDLVICNIYRNFIRNIGATTYAKAGITGINQGTGTRFRAWHNVIIGAGSYGVIVTGVGSFAEVFCNVIVIDANIAAVLGAGIASLTAPLVAMNNTIINNAAGAQEAASFAIDNVNAFCVIANNLSLALGAKALHMLALAEFTQGNYCDYNCYWDDTAVPAHGGGDDGRFRILSSGYHQFQTRGAGGAYTGWRNQSTAVLVDSFGLVSDPLLTDEDVRTIEGAVPRETSPVYGAGVNGYELCRQLGLNAPASQNDIFGRPWPRPTKGAWDIGAVRWPLRNHPAAQALMTP